MCKVRITAIMRRRERVEKTVIYGVFFFYVLLLMKILFFSRVSFFELFGTQRTIDRAVNFIPFHSIIEYLSGRTETLRTFSYANVVGNIAIFMPLGAYLALFRAGKGILANLLFIFLASMMTEMIQWIFGIGTADIDDVILNCIGGLVGILGYKLLVCVLRDEKRAQTAIAILSILGSPFVWYYLFMIKMRL